MLKYLASKKEKQFLKETLLETEILDSGIGLVIV